MKAKFPFLLLLLIILLGGSIYYFMPSSEDSADKALLVTVLNYSKAGDPSLEGFKEGLRKLGYIENRDIRYIYSGHISDREKLVKEGERLLSLNPDLILTISTPATLTAKKLTESSRIPVVFAPVSRPVKAKIVKSFSHPGGNITGVTFGPQEPKRLEMLVLIAPSVKRVYVPFNPDDKNAQTGVRILKQAADKLNLELVLSEINDYNLIAKKLKNLPDNIDAIFLPTDSLMVAQVPLFARTAIEKKLVLSGPQREAVTSGALFSYGFSVRDSGYQAARMADLIFKGTRPETIPVEITDFILTINMDVADQIGIKVPDTVLRQAKIIRH